MNLNTLCHCIRDPPDTIKMQSSYLNCLLYADILTTIMARLLQVFRLNHITKMKIFKSFDVGKLNDCSKKVAYPIVCQQSVKSF